MPSIQVAFDHLMDLALPFQLAKRLVELLYKCFAIWMRARDDKVLNRFPYGILIDFEIVTMAKKLVDHGPTNDVDDANDIHSAFGKHLKTEFDVWRPDKRYRVIGQQILEP